MSLLKKFGLTVAPLALAGAISGCDQYDHEEKPDGKNVSLTVLSKESVALPVNQDGTGGGSEYRVHTNNGVFKNTDSILFMKFNSADLQNSLKIGNSYRCEAFGPRIPLLSEFPNLVSCEETKSSSTTSKKPEQDNAEEIVCKKIDGEIYCPQ